MPEIASWESLFGGLYKPSTATGDYIEGEVADSQAAPADTEAAELPGYSVTQPEPQATAQAAPVETTGEAAETPTSDRFNQVQNLVQSIDQLAQGARLPGGAPAGGWEASPAQLPDYAMDATDPRTFGATFTNEGVVYGGMHWDATQGKLVPGANYRIPGTPLSEAGQAAYAADPLGGQDVAFQQSYMEPFRAMQQAETDRWVQQPDGTWRDPLTGSFSLTKPEASGTGPAYWTYLMGQEGNQYAGAALDKYMRRLGINV